MPTNIAALLESRRHRIVAAVRKRYPHLCGGRVDDAVSAIVLRACEHPEVFEGVRDRDGDAALMRYAVTAARRAAKDQIRRRAYLAESTALSEVRLPCRQGGQEALLAARDLDARIGVCAAAVNGRHVEPLRAALWEKVLEGAPDTELAERHGVRREYVNRAWRQLQAAA